jgi:cytochrome c-type biogenesis protein CcmF
MGEDTVFSYNRVIIFVAIIIGILTAVVQYLKYKQTDPGFFRKKIIAPTGRFFDHFYVGPCIWKH